MQIMINEKYIINTDFVMYIEEIIDEEKFIKERIEQCKQVEPVYYSKIVMKDSREIIIDKNVKEVWKIINGKV